MKGCSSTASAAPTGAAFATNSCTAATPPWIQPYTRLTDPNTGGKSAPAGTAFVAGPGKPLSNPHVSLIFWGGWWAGNPLATQVVNAVKGLLAGPYLSYLKQYGVRRGDVRGATFAVDREPGLAFTDEDVSNLVIALLDDDQLPEPDDNYPNVYAVMLPVNSAYAGLAPFDPQPLGGVVSTVIGINSSVTWSDYDLGDVDNDPAHWLWVGNDGTLDYIMTIFAHELVEIITDPNGGDGVVQVAPPPAASAAQIADVGEAWCDHVPNGGRAQSYWSIADNALVLPKMYSVRRTLTGTSIGGRFPRTPSAKAWIAQQF